MDISELSSSDLHQFTSEESSRYSRQMILAEIGVEGQQKLRSTKVLVIGAGGIGSAVLIYLAGMGVGQLGIIDGDRVEIENLHRQVIYSQKSIGISKVLAARDFIKAYNPNVDVILHDHPIDQKNVEEIVQSYDYIIDGSDNPTCRYVVSDACRKQGVILISGAAVKWEGQVTILCYADGPCYRCLYPECPPPSQILSCASNGVVSTAPGIVGVLLATQLLKLVLKFDVKDVLFKKIAVINLKNDSFKVYSLAGRSPSCSICSNPGEFDIRNFDYQSFVGAASSCQDWDCSWDALWTHTDENSFLLDVRPDEHRKTKPIERACHIPVSRILEMERDELLKRLNINCEVNKEIFVFCRSGVNSKIAVKKLRQEGIICYSIIGGINSQIL